MSTAQRGEPGTSVARQEPERDARLTADARARLQKIRSDNAFTMAVTAESWGDRMTVTTRRAFAEFIRRFRLDISEVDNLGNRPYRNGYYYRRRVAEMRTAGQVDWSLGEHIGPNKELDRLAAMTESDPAYDPELTQWAREERRRRAQERIRWEVPEDASHAYVVRVKLKGDQNPLEGCDWITPARTKKVKKWENKRFAGWEEKVADPVGAEEPEKTVITRAWRRCGLLVAAEIPELKQEEAVMDSAAEEISIAIDERDEEEAAREVSAHRPRELPLAVREDNPYEIDDDAPGNTREAARVTPAGRSETHTRAAETAAAMRDPYDDRDEPAPSDGHAATDRHEMQPNRGAIDTTKGPHAMPLPFNIGLARIKTPLREISNEDLGKALAFARNVGKYVELVEAISLVLDDRRAGDAIEPKAEASA